MASANPPLEKIKTPDFINLLEHNLIKRDVSIIEFAESDEFCGKPLYPRQRTLLKLIFLEELNGYDEDVLDEWIDSSERGGEVRICPGIRERIEHLREQDYNHFRHVLLVGGRRSSKGHLTGLALAKKVYDLVLLDNVGNYYNIDADKDVYLQILADSKDQAKANVFQDATNWILQCRPFADQNLISKLLAETTSVFTPYDKQRVLKIEAQQGKVERDLAKIKVQVYGTNSRTIRGQAVIAICFDEMAHLIGGESRLSDTELYEAATPGLSTFGKDAFIAAVSSPYTKTGKFYKLFENSLELDPPEIGIPKYPDTFMLQFPSWELYKDWDKDPTHKWSGAIMVDPKYDAILRQEEMANPDSFKVEYRGQFAEVVSAFLNPEMVDRMFNPEFTKSKIGRTIKTEWGAQGFITYKAHGDPSSTGANFGIAIAHVEDVTEELLNVDGVPTGEVIVAPHVVFDLVHAFYPEDFPNHTIDWMEVLPVIKQLANAFRPFEWTFDQYDSSYPIQKLSADLALIGAQEVQVYEKTATAAKNLKRAMNFKAALNLGRVHAPHPTFPVENQNRRSIELVRQELKFLQEKSGRIDKQDIGPVRTKDIADCLFECVDALIGDSVSNMALAAARPEFGGFGGYSYSKTAKDNPYNDVFSSQFYGNQKTGTPLSQGGRFNRMHNKRGKR